MSGIITDVTTGLTPAVLLGTVGDLVPLLIVLVPVSLGIYFLRKLIKGSAQAKVKF